MPADDPELKPKFHRSSKPDPDLAAGAAAGVVEEAGRGTWPPNPRVLPPRVGVPVVRVGESGAPPNPALVVEVGLRGAAAKSGADCVGLIGVGALPNPESGRATPPSEGVDWCREAGVDALRISIRLDLGAAAGGELATGAA